MMVIYVCFLFFCLALQYVLVFPHLPYYWSIVNLSFFLTTILFLSLVNCTDPGFIKNQVDFLKMLKVCESTELCPDCQTVRTARSRHCAVCHKCVERFDHHCPWVNNCIGLRNHNYFLIYTTS